MSASAISKKQKPICEKALSLSNDEPDVLNYLGYSWLTRHHNITEARKLIEKAYDQRPEKIRKLLLTPWAMRSLWR